MLPDDEWIASIRRRYETPAESHHLDPAQINEGDRGNRMPSQFFRRIIARGASKPGEWDRSSISICTVASTTKKLGTISLAKEKISINRTEFVYGSTEMISL
ncbi:MAG TPA: hypothetical protein VGN72_01775 [Tepidisphaeraceae bacterium]|nr:hypothetical protein [Tepidisphaeraceae bacterium]